MCISAVLCAELYPKCFQRVKKAKNVLPGPWWIQRTSKLLVHIVSCPYCLMCICVCRLVGIVAATATIPRTPQGMHLTQPTFKDCY